MLVLRRYHFFLFILLFLGCVAELSAQSRADSVLVRLKSQALFPLFEDGTSPWVMVKDIEMEGNKITRYGIITREMVFGEGDSLSLNELLHRMEESRENLLNTSLFNFVEMDLDLTAFPAVKVKVLLVERWYLWPFPILERGDRNINEWLGNPGLSRMNYGMYLVWDNFRGRRERI